MENFNDSKALAIEIAKILDKKKAQDLLYILGAGCIAGSALYSFFASTLKLTNINKK